MGVKEELIKEAQELEGASAEEVLKWAFRTYGDKVKIASSFGAEDVVLVDLAARVNPGVKVFTLDTGRLAQETYDVIDNVNKKYNIKTEFFCPDGKVLEEVSNEYGPSLFYDSVEMRKKCCGIRKMEPLKRAMSTLDAWVCGLRKEQAVTRTDIKKVEFSDTGAPVKINPLTEWTEQDIWDYIRINNVPYNALHDKGYPSIGCICCTRTVKRTEDVRAGRWWWESPESKECGLHRK
jgi:phosphoadenosine phosphosulfate reductase